MEDLLAEKIHIDEKAEKYILIACRQYNFIAVVFVIASMLNLTIQSLRFLRASKISFHNWINIFNFYLLPFIVIAHVLLSLAQLYYYYNGVMYQKKAIAGSDQQLFTKSFRFYKNGNNFGIAALIISLSYVIVFIYQEMRMPLN